MNFSNVTKYDCELELQVYDSNKLIKEIQGKNTIMSTGYSGIYENLISKSSLDTKVYGPIAYCLFGTSTVSSNVSNTYSSFGETDGNHRYANEINTYNIGNNIRVNINLEEHEFNIPAQLSPNLPISCVGLGLYSKEILNGYIVPNYVFNRVLLAEGDRFYKTYNIRIGGTWNITITQ